MLITILTTGTRGDTQPYVALGIGLQKAGHIVRLAGFENFKDFVEKHGLEFYPIKGDVSLMASSTSTKDARQADNPLKFLLSFNKLKDLAAGLQTDFFNACAGSDLIIYHPGAAIGYFAAQRMGIPSVLATPFPMAPTRAYPSLIFYDGPRLGPWYNLASHKILEQIMWFASSSATKQLWKTRFGSLPPNFSAPFDRQNTRRAPTIVSCSQYVFPTPADWPEHVHNTGYWFLENEAGWQPPAGLLDFLGAGSPPVYVGFGSVGDAQTARQTTRLVVDALRRSGQRGILATGWNGMTRLEETSDDIFILESAPHGWLFPLMAAVVHHGGAGTTAAGLQAGVPSIIIPASNDQFGWARRVYELGVGPKPIPRRKLTPENLSAAIGLALKQEIRTAAAELGARIRVESGVENAVKIILDVRQN